VTAVWVTIGALSVGTAAIKSVGPLTLGGREPGERTFAVLALFAPALLAALIVYETLTDGHDGITVDQRVIGVGAAATGLALRAPIAVVVIGAAGATALARPVA
jgi:hypothetical protein